jgi:hypothetical protein
MAFGFLSKFFSFFHRSTGPDAGSRRLLKQLAKDLQRSRFARFYKPRTMEVQPALGKFFYDIYKTVAHAQVFLQNAAKSAELKQLTVEAFLDMRHLDARQRLNAGYVEERAKTMPITEVSHLLKEDLVILSSAFDQDFISKVDMCYNQILSIMELANFDYFFFLRKFDPNILERNFNSTPLFKQVRGTMLSEEIKDFLVASYTVETGLDWSIPLQVIKVYKNGLEVIPEEDWSKVMGNLRELRRTGILELIVRHIDQNPRWEFKTQVSLEHIAASYLEDRRKEVDGALTGFLSSQRQNQVNSLAAELFGDPEIKRLFNYTARDGEIYVQRGMEGFIYAQSLNFLKAFLVDFFQKDIQSLCDLLLIRGLWASVEQSQRMSETFNILRDNTDRLLALERSLGENGEDGAKLRTALAKSDRDRSQIRHMNFLFQKVNGEAWDLLSSTAESLIVLGGYLKDILVDAKEGGILIMNYRELQLMSEVPLNQQIILTYKRIFAYLQIQQLLINSDNTLETV